MADEAERLELAEQVCYSLLLAMEFGIWPAEKLTQEERDFVAGPMAAWAAVACPEKVT